MPRKLRVEYPGAVFGDVGEACGKTDWEVQAFCLAPDHFHRVGETSTENLVTGMPWFLGTQRAGFKRRHQFLGPLFGGRCMALIMDDPMGLCFWGGGD